MTAHFPLDRLAAALRADGISVTVLSGAQGRSARQFAMSGYYRGCQASVAHHTGSSGSNPSGDIQYILNGQGDGFVISNAYTARDGRVTLIASGPTYTEGAGGPRGIIPENRANDVCFSNEIGGGIGASYPTAQQRSVVHFHRYANRIAADVWDWPDNPYSPNRLFSHFEWAPGRKTDPKGACDWAAGYTMWNMNGFRADVATALDPPGDDDMRTIRPQRLYDSRQHGILLPGQPRAILATTGTYGAAFVTVAAGLANGPGFLSYSPDNNFAGDTSFLNFQGGSQFIANSIPVLTPGRKFWIRANVSACHIVVDQYAEG